MDDMEKSITLGTQLGYQGTDLQGFVEKQTIKAEKLEAEKHEGVSVLIDVRRNVYHVKLRLNVYHVKLRRNVCHVKLRLNVCHVRSKCEKWN